MKTANELLEEITEAGKMTEDEKEQYLSLVTMSMKSAPDRVKYKHINPEYGSYFDAKSFGTLIGEVITNGRVARVLSSPNYTFIYVRGVKGTLNILHVNSRVKNTDPLSKYIGQTLHGSVTDKKMMSMLTRMDYTVMNDSTDIMKVVFNSRGKMVSFYPDYSMEPQSGYNIKLKNGE